MILRQNPQEPSPVDGVVDKGATPRKCHPLSLEQELQTLCFSPSVVAQAQAGFYTSSQIEMLKRQKIRVQEVISAETRLSSRSQLGASLTTIRTATPRPRYNSCPCTFKCCQCCRPFLIERCWTSFEAVLAGEVRPLSLTDITVLPIKSPMIACTLGRFGSITYTCTESSEIQHARSFFDSGPNLPAAETATPSTATSDTFSYTEFSYADEHERGNYDWLDEADNVRNDNEENFSIAYAKPHRALSTPEPTMRHTIRRASGSIGDCSVRYSVASSSSISLPTPSTARTSPMQFPDDNGKSDANSTRHFGRAADRADKVADLAHHYQDGATAPCHRASNAMAFLMSTNSSTESLVHLGDEVEVDGGIALTEEAIRTSTPDLATDARNVYA